MNIVSVFVVANLYLFFIVVFHRMFCKHERRKLVYGFLLGNSIILTGLVLTVLLWLQIQTL